MPAADGLSLRTESAPAKEPTRCCREAGSSSRLQAAEGLGARRKTPPQRWDTAETAPLGDPPTPLPRAAGTEQFSKKNNHQHNRCWRWVRTPAPPSGSAAFTGCSSAQGGPHPLPPSSVATLKFLILEQGDPCVHCAQTVQGQHPVRIVVPRGPQRNQNSSRRPLLGCPRDQGTKEEETL